MHVCVCMCVRGKKCVFAILVCLWPLIVWLPLDCHQAVSEVMLTPHPPTYFQRGVSQCVRVLPVRFKLGAKHKWSDENEEKIGWQMNVQCSVRQILYAGCWSDIWTSHNLPISSAIFRPTNYHRAWLLFTVLFHILYSQCPTSCAWRQTTAATSWSFLRTL